MAAVPYVSGRSTYRGGAKREQDMILRYNSKRVLMSFIMHSCERRNLFPFCLVLPPALVGVDRVTGLVIADAAGRSTLAVDQQSFIQSDRSGSATSLLDDPKG